MESLQLHVIPGHKLCKRCHEKIKNKIETLQAHQHNTDSNDEGNDPDYFVPEDNNNSSRD